MVKRYAQDEPSDVLILGKPRTRDRRDGVRHWRQPSQLGELGRRGGAARGFAEVHRPLLTDPQTSGGPLVACAASEVGAVMEIIGRHRFDEAAAVGSVAAHVEGVRLVLG